VKWPWALAIAVILMGRAGREAQAYTGGPVRAGVVGYEPKEHKVYYWMQGFDESGDPGRYYYILLDSLGSMKSVEAVSWGAREESDSLASEQKLARFKKRLLPLLALDASKVMVNVAVTKRDSNLNFQVPQFELAVDVSSGALHSSLELDAYCSTEVAVYSLYAIPERDEQVGLMRYKGRVYYCEPVETPILLRTTEAKRQRLSKYEGP